MAGLFLFVQHVLKALRESEEDLKMAKRFTDTQIWKEDWFIALPRDYQILWQFVKDECNHAGIWKPNVSGLKSFKFKGSLSDGLKLLNQDKERVALTASGKWFLIGFIPFQYGHVLNTKNRVHLSIITELKKEGVKLGSIRPQIEVNDSLKDKDKDKD